MNQTVRNNMLQSLFKSIKLSLSHLIEVIEVTGVKFIFIEVVTAVNSNIFDFIKVITSILKTSLK